MQQHPPHPNLGRVSRPAALAAAVSATLLLLLEPSLAAWDAESQEAIREADRSFVVMTDPEQSTDPIAPSDILESMLPWLDAGCPRDAQASDPRLKLLAEGPVFGTMSSPDTPFPVAGENAVTAMLLAKAVFSEDDQEELPIYNLISRPWEYMTRQPWPIFSLLDGLARKWRGNPSFQQDFMANCDPDSASFWESEQTRIVGDALWVASRSPSLMPSVARLSVTHLLTEGFSISDENSPQICNRVKHILLTLLLPLLENPFSTDGYAIRKVHGYLVETYLRERSDVGLRELLGSPWPVLPLLSHFAKLAFEGPTLHTKVLPKVATTESVLEAEIVPEPFRPMEPVDGETLELSLKMSHRLFAAAQIPYMAIAGTLLGSVRHADRIPWDDDVDLCVDAVHESRLFGMVLVQVAHSLGVKTTVGLSERSLRAVELLRHEGFEFSIYAGRSLVFRTLPMWAREKISLGVDVPFVDTWLCWGLQGENAGEVAMMSSSYGPRLPVSTVFPLRKVPFAGLVLWAPYDAELATSTYFNSGDDLKDLDGQHDWRRFCVGRKLHAARGKMEFRDQVNCSALASRFAFSLYGPFTALPALEGGAARERERALKAVQAAKSRFPGIMLELPQAVVEAASDLFTPESHSRRYRVTVPALCNGVQLTCTAMLWRGDDDKADMVLEGWVPQFQGSGDGPPVLRSFLCYELPVNTREFRSPFYVWEDQWI